MKKLLFVIIIFISFSSFSQITKTRFEYSYDRTGVSLSYTVKKMILFKDLKIMKKEIQPIGSLISTQIDEITYLN